MATLPNGVVIVVQGSSITVPVMANVDLKSMCKRQFRNT